MNASHSAQLRDGQRLFVRIGVPLHRDRTQRHSDDRCEAGVSCYEVLSDRGLLWIVSDPLDPAATRRKIQEGRQNDTPLYLVQGHVVGTGTDGEPLLRVQSCKPIPGLTAGHLRIGPPQ